MNQIHLTIRTMTWDEASTYGLVNQGLMLEHNCVSYRLSAGASDDVHIFKSGVTLFVLTINTVLDYVALDAYVGREDEPVDSIFLQGDWAIEECLGRRWRSLSLTNLAGRLINQAAS